MLKDKMHVHQEKSSDSAIIKGSAEQLQQSGGLKQSNLRSKISDVEEYEHRNDIVRTNEGATVNLIRIKRSKRGKKDPFLSELVKRLWIGIQRAWNKWNTKENWEKTRDILEEVLDHLDSHEDTAINDKIPQGNVTEMSQEQLNLKLINAVKQSNLNEVKEYSSKGADLDTKDNGKTPLHIASKEGFSEIAMFLLDNGADVDIQEDESGMSPLHLASMGGHLDIVEYLVENGADVDVYQGGWSYSTPLHLASQNGHFDTVKYLMAKGANPKATDDAGKIPMERADENGHLEIVEYFKTRGLKVAEVTTERQQTTGDYGITFLHSAAEQGNLIAVKYYVDKGVDLNAKDSFGRTPLHLAAEKGHLYIVKYLVEEGADVNAREFVGMGAKLPLHYAALNGHLDVVKYFVGEKSVNPNDKAHNSWTPLLMATRNNHFNIVKYLIDEKNADFTVTEVNGFTPLHMAAYNGNLDIVKYLVGEKNADVTAKTNGGDTPLKDATFSGNFEVVEYLKSKSHRKRRTIEPKHSTMIQPENKTNKLSLWMGNIVNWIRGTESQSLITYSEQSSTTTSATTEMNIVNNTMLLAILAAGLFNRTSHSKPSHENLLSPREQVTNNINNSRRFLEKSLRKGEEEAWGSTMNEAENGSNKTDFWKRK